MNGSEPATVPQLVAVPEDWHRALAIVAHPDDLEYGAASAIARWTKQGKDIVYLLVTRGEAGISTMDPSEAGPVREAEERAGAALVGVTTVEFLDHRDGVVEYGLALRLDLARAIRRHRPHVLITINHHERWAFGGVNQADHRHVGLAAVDAGRDAANRWIFAELIGEGLEPWSGLRFVAVSESPFAGHAVDVTDTVELGIASLRAHAAYLAALDLPPDPDAFVRGIVNGGAEYFGGRPAVRFELIDL